MSTRPADPVRDLLRQLPEAFWDVDIWNRDEHLGSGTVDVYDRKRIVTEVKRLIDGDEAEDFTGSTYEHAVKFCPCPRCATARNDG